MLLISPFTIDFARCRRARCIKQYLCCLLLLCDHRRHLLASFVYLQAGDLGGLAKRLLPDAKEHDALYFQAMINVQGESSLTYEVRVSVVSDVERSCWDRRRKHCLGFWGAGLIALA